jgi:hypothetical protein
MQFLIEKVLANWRPQLIKSGHRVLLPSPVGPLRLVVLRCLGARAGLSSNTGRPRVAVHVLNGLREDRPLIRHHSSLYTLMSSFFFIAPKPYETLWLQGRRASINGAYFSWYFISTSGIFTNIPHQLWMELGALVTVIPGLCLLLSFT